MPTFAEMREKVRKVFASDKAKRLDELVEEKAIAQELDALRQFEAVMMPDALRQPDRTRALVEDEHGHPLSAAGAFAPTAAEFDKMWRAQWDRLVSRWGVETIRPTAAPLAAIATKARKSRQEDFVSQSAIEHVATYLELKAQIAALEAEAAEAKQRVCDTLGTANAGPGESWDYPGIGRVVIVKGRRSEKLDRAVLAAAGVAAKVLDKATVVTQGDPSVRIEALEDEEKAAPQPAMLPAGTIEIGPHRISPVSEQCFRCGLTLRTIVSVSGDAAHCGDRS